MSPQNNQPKWWRYQRVCAVSGHREAIDLCHLNCAVGTHFHPTRAEAEDLVTSGAAEWIVMPMSRKDRGVIRLVTNVAGCRGFSAKFGPYLALKRNQPVVRVIVHDIRRRRPGQWCQQFAATGKFFGEREK